ncbi:MAG: Crp/Fnr family transcriptional regulator [Acidisphaera sp.]|nr:Crp/Fnr family transcriptional regulator [Acidisphaera sp.]
MVEKDNGVIGAGAPSGEERGLHSEGTLLIRRLERLAPLHDDDRRALLELPIRAKAHYADQDIVREGDRPTECGLVLKGFVFRHKLVADGRRQIVSFNPAGEIPDLQSLYLPRLDYSIGTLVPTRMGYVPHQALRALVQSRPSIAAALWREIVVEASIFREWMVSLGRRSAYQRVAHLLCEIGLKLEMAGHGTRSEYEFPVTQSELADALGISTVHANRVVQELRRTNIVVWRGSSVTILDWRALQEAGEFDPAYLHIQ